MVALAGVLMLVAARMAFATGDISYITQDRGILFPSANMWIHSPWMEMAVNTGMTLALALGLMTLIQVYNPFRTLTSMSGTWVLVIAVATPDLLDQFTSGTLVAATVTVSLALLWSCFADASKLRHIFLIFFFLSLLSMTQYCYVAYMPVFLIGCLQMKIMSWRTLWAILLGLITPWWIVLGCGLRSVNDIHWPEVVGFFNGFVPSQALHLALAAALTGLVCVVTWAMNAIKVLSLNANLRAMNGSMSVTMIFTLAAMLADFTNAAAYQSVLTLCAAYQLTMAFATRGGDRRFVWALILIAMYYGLYVWRIYL